MLTASPRPTARRSTSGTGGGKDNQKFRLDPWAMATTESPQSTAASAWTWRACPPQTAPASIQWDWWGGNNQQRRLGPAFDRIAALWQGPRHRRNPPTSGARAIQWDYWGGGNQKFRLDPVGDGYYRVMAEHAGKCLDVAVSPLANGAQVIQWEWWGGDNQRFKPEHTVTGYLPPRRQAQRQMPGCQRHLRRERRPSHSVGMVGGNNQQWRPRSAVVRTIAGLIAAMASDCGAYLCA